MYDRVMGQVTKLVVLVLGLISIYGFRNQEVENGNGRKRNLVDVCKRSRMIRDIRLFLFLLGFFRVFLYIQNSSRTKVWHTRELTNLLSLSLSLSHTHTQYIHCMHISMYRGWIVPFHVWVWYEYWRMSMARMVRMARTMLQTYPHCV